MATDLIQLLSKGIAQAVQSYSASSPTQSRLEIIGQASMLIRAVAQPEEMMFESVTVRTLMSLRVFHALPDKGSISLKQLSAQTGAEEALLIRLLRLAVACQLVQQLADGTFTHTKFSRGYAMDPGPGLAFNLLYDECFLQLTRFHLYLEEKGAKEPDSQFTSPFAWNEGQEGKAIWEIMAQHPERFATFQRGLPFYDANLPKTGYYDFGKLADAVNTDRPAIVDIGCGLGQTMVEICIAHPALKSTKIVLEDMPNVLQAAKEGGNLPDNFELLPHDFYTPQPIKGAKAYYLRRVMHDYSDKVCLTILQQIVPAMAPDSVVLISDYIVPAQITPADIEVATAGVLMFQMAGKERSEEDFVKLFEQAGLVLNGVFTTGFGNYGLVEAKLKSTAPGIQNGVH